MKHIHHSAKPIDINGVHYATRHEAAKALGISESTLSKRLSRTGIQKIDRPKNTQANNIYPITIDNHTFYSNRDLAKHLNMSESKISYTLQDLIANHLPITKDNILMLNKHRLTEIINDKVYHHYKDIAKDYNISFSMIHKRRSQGLHGAQLVAPVKSRPKIKPVVIDGVKYANLKDAARALHISYQKLHYRYAQYQAGHMTEEELLQTDKIGSHHYHTVINGKKYLRLKDITNDYPASYHQVKRWHILLRQNIIDQETFERWIINGEKD